MWKGTFEKDQLVAVKPVSPTPFHQCHPLSSRATPRHKRTGPRTHPLRTVHRSRAQAQRGSFWVEDWERPSPGVLGLCPWGHSASACSHVHVFTTGKAPSLKLLESRVLGSYCVTGYTASSGSLSSSSWRFWRSQAGPKVWALRSHGQPLP